MRPSYHIFYQLCKNTLGEDEPEQAAVLEGIGPAKSFSCTPHPPRPCAPPFRRGSAVSLRFCSFGGCSFR